MPRLTGCWPNTKKESKSKMSFLPSADTVLLRVVVDEKAPVSQRVAALKLVKHAPMTILRNLLVESKTPGKKPVPSKLKAVAALAYSREMELKKIRKLRKPLSNQKCDNALGII